MPTTADNLSDLRDAMTLGLPLAACWNVGGFPHSWHVQQVRNGHRFLPSIKFPPLDSLDDKKLALFFDAPTVAALSYLDVNALPLCLRMINIQGEFAGEWSLKNPKRYALPKVPESIPLSPLNWKQMPDGTLDDGQIVDRLAPKSIWINHGMLWATSPFTLKLQSLHRSPAYLVAIENNEGFEDDLEAYTIKTDAKNEFGYPVRRWLTPDVLGRRSIRMRDRVLGQESGVGNQVSANPLTPDPWPLTPAPLDPYDLQPEWFRRRADQYEGLYSGFDSALGLAWSRKLYTGGYGAMQKDALGALPPMHLDEIGYAPMALSYDGPSPFVYVAGSTDVVDFTDPDQTKVFNLIPAWEWLRAGNPRAYRELSVMITGGAILAGKLSGKHEVITPARYEGHMQWLLWGLRAPGVPTILRYYAGNATKPTDPIFDVTDQANLAKLGVGAWGTGIGDSGTGTGGNLQSPAPAPIPQSLSTLTVGDYVEALCRAVDRVCTGDRRDFWLYGKPIVNPNGNVPTDEVQHNQGFSPYIPPGQPDHRWRFLDVSCNTPRDGWYVKRLKGKGTIVYDPPATPPVVKVWALATVLDGRALLYAWTACDPAGVGPFSVRVPGFGDVTVDFEGRPYRYWIVTPNGATAVPLE